EATGKDAAVVTAINGARRKVPHPSYQAWTYAALIRDFNDTVQEESIRLRPCAYLHNLKSDAAVNAPFYAQHTTRAPAFVREDVQPLVQLLLRYVRPGDRWLILYMTERGRAQQTKNLIDHVVSLLEGNREFELINDKKN